MSYSDFVISKFEKKKIREQNMAMSAQNEKSAYQQNMAQPVQTTEVPSIRGTVARIMQISNNDPQRGYELQRDFNYLQTQRDSMYYDPFTAPTNPAISALQSYGVDTSNPDWYENYSHLKNYYVSSGTTNNATKPGKNAPIEQQAAYWYSIADAARADTDKAKQEIAALQEEIGFYANWNSRNYSDERISSMFDFEDDRNEDLRKKYPTLYKMITTKNSGEPMKLNEAVSLANQDWVHGQIWAARNNGGTGDAYSDMANSYLGVGNVYKEDPEITARLTFGTDTYAPYTAGSTLDDVCKYYGTYKIDRNYLDTHLPDERDKTEMDMWYKADAAVSFTEDAQREAAEANAWLDEQLSSATEADAQNILKQLDRKLRNKWEHLKQMDDSTKKPGNLIGTTDAIDYSYNDAKRKIAEACGVNSEKLTASQTVGKYGITTQTDQSAEIEQAGKSNVTSARVELDDQMNQSEKNVFSNTPSTFWGFLWNTLSQIDPIELIKKNEPEQTSKYVTGITELNAQIDKNQAAQAELDNLNRANAEITNRLDTIRDSFRAGGGEFGFMYDLEDGEYIQVNDAYVPNSRYAQALVDLYNAATGGDAEYGEIKDITKQAKEFYDYIMNYTPTYEEDEEVPFVLSALSGKKKELEATVEQTKNAQSDYDKQQEAWNKKIELYDRIGLDTTGLRAAQVVTDALPYFSEYQKIERLPYGYFDMESLDLGDNATYDQVIENTAQDVEKARNNLEAAAFIKEYCADQNISIPADYAANIDRFIGENERLLKDYEYYTLRGESDFAKLAEEGREREEREKKKGRLGFDEISANDEIAFGLDRSEFYNIMSDAEKDTFYYLYAKGGFDPAMEYYLHLADETYGVLHTRNRMEIEKNASEEVNRSFLSGLWANAKAILGTGLEALSALGYDLERLFTGKEYNEDSSSRRYGIYSNTVNAETTKAIKEGLGRKNENGEIEDTIWSQIFGGLYEIGYMRGRSFVNGLLTGGLTSGISSSIIKEILGAFPMGLSAADSAIANAVEKGAKPWEAYVIGGITLLAETFSEGITYGNIQEALNGSKDEAVRGIRDLLVNWLTDNGLEEMVGEVSTDFIEGLADKYLLGDNSDHKALVDSYIEKLKLDPNDPLARERAEELARKDEMGSLLHTAIISYLSPGMDVFAGAISDKVRDLQNIRLTTRELQKQGFNVSFADVRKDYHQWKEQMQNEPTTTQTNNRIETEQENTARQGIDQQEASQNEAARQEAQAANLTAGYAIGQEHAPAQQRQAPTPSEADMAFVNELNLLESVITSDSSTQADAIGTVLGGEENTAAGDESHAAAANMTNLFRTMGDSVTQIWSLMYGAHDMGMDEAVKTAIKMAALSEQSASAQVIKSEAFRTAPSIEAQVNMLVQAVTQDQQNQAVVQDMVKNVREYRIAAKMAELVKQNPLTATPAAQEAADKAAETMQQAESALTEAQNVKQAKEDASNAARTEAINNPTKENTDANTKALNELEGATVAETQAEAHLEKTQQANEAAQAKAEEAKQQELNRVRQEAEQLVAQEDQQRAEIAAKQAAEQQDIAKQQAQAKAEADERSGKAWEDQRDSIIEDILNSEHLEGTAREDRRAQLQDMAENIKLKKIDMTGLMNNTEGYLAVSALGRKLGLGVQLSDTLPGNARGMYENGVVYLNNNLIKNGKMTIGQALVEATLHEITHSMEDTKNYQTYRKTVLEALFSGEDEAIRTAMDLTDADGKVTGSVNIDRAAYEAAIDQKIADYKNSVNKNLSREEAEREIIADFARTKLNNKDVVNRLMDAGLGGRMRNALHNINQAIKNFRLTGEEKKTAEYLRRAERAFQRAMDEVARTETHPEGGQFSVAQIAQSTGMTFNPETLKLYDQNGNEVDGVTNVVTPEMITSSPVGMLIDSGLTGEQNQKAKEMMAGLMNMVAKYKDSNLIWEIGATTLSSTFSALKSNSDPQYKTTVDFGTVCAKTQAIVDVMSKVMTDKIDPKTGMLKEGAQRGLTREDVMKVYDAVNKAGLSVPCPVCYVFSRWMGVPSLLGQMSQYQADYVVTNEDGSINKEETQKVASRYIKEAEAKYGDAKTINNAKTKMQNSLAKLENTRMDLEAQLKDKSLTDKQRKSIEAKIKETLGQMTELDKQIGEVSAYNWITQALCKKDKSGNYVVDDKFRLTPDAVLFDLNRTGEFAEYEKNWKYRNTRGAGMGKAIMPYSGETIGDILYGVKNGGRQNTIKNPWLNMDSKAAARQLRYAQERAAKQNLVGGQRLQSTSDFRPEWGLDYIMSFLELQAAGSKVQMYTKVAEAVDFFASVGADVNMSIMGKGQGWHVDEDGNYVLDFSNITGMDYDTAKALKDKYNNVQMILVGMNDIHIRLALGNNDIDFVIP
jgi:hypothetical protein